MPNQEMVVFELNGRLNQEEIKRGIRPTGHRKDSVQLNHCHDNKLDKIILEQ